MSADESDQPSSSNIRVSNDTEDEEGSEHDGDSEEEPGDDTHSTHNEDDSDGDHDRTEDDMGGFIAPDDHYSESEEERPRKRSRKKRKRKRAEMDSDSGFDDELSGDDLDFVNEMDQQNNRGKSGRRRKKSGKSSHRRKNDGFDLDDGDDGDDLDFSSDEDGNSEKRSSRLVKRDSRLDQAMDDDDYYSDDDGDDDVFNRHGFEQGRRPDEPFVVGGDIGAALGLTGTDTWIHKLFGENLIAFLDASHKTKAEEQMESTNEFTQKLLRSDQSTILQTEKALEVSNNAHLTEIGKSKLRMQLRKKRLEEKQYVNSLRGLPTQASKERKRRSLRIRRSSIPERIYSRITEQIKDQDSEAMLKAESIWIVNGRYFVERNRQAVLAAKNRDRKDGKSLLSSSSSSLSSSLSLAIDSKNPLMGGSHDRDGDVNMGGIGKGNNGEIKVKITDEDLLEVVKMIRVEHLDLPFIDLYRRNKISPLLTTEDLWMVDQLDHEWQFLIQRKTWLLQKLNITFTKMLSNYRIMTQIMKILSIRQDSSDSNVSGSGSARSTRDHRSPSSAVSSSFTDDCLLIEDDSQFSLVSQLTSQVLSDPSPLETKVMMMRRTKKEDPYAYELDSIIPSASPPPVSVQQQQQQQQQQPSELPLVDVKMAMAHPGQSSRELESSIVSRNPGVTSLTNIVPNSPMVGLFGVRLDEITKNTPSQVSMEESQMFSEECKKYLTRHPRFLAVMKQIKVWMQRIKMMRDCVANAPDHRGELDDVEEFLSVVPDTAVNRYIYQGKVIEDIMSVCRDSMNKFVLRLRQQHQGLHSDLSVSGMISMSEAWKNKFFQEVEQRLNDYFDDLREKFNRGSNKKRGSLMNGGQTTRDIRSIKVPTDKLSDPECMNILRVWNHENSEIRGSGNDVYWNSVSKLKQLKHAHKRVLMIMNEWKQCKQGQRERMDADQSGRDVDMTDHMNNDDDNRNVVIITQNDIEETDAFMEVESASSLTVTQLQMCIDRLKEEITHWSDLYSYYSRLFDYALQQQPQGNSEAEAESGAAGTTSALSSSLTTTTGVTDSDAQMMRLEKPSALDPSRYEKYGAHEFIRDFESDMNGNLDELKDHAKLVSERVRDLDAMIEDFKQALENRNHDCEVLHGYYTEVCLILPDEDDDDGSAAADESSDSNSSSDEEMKKEGNEDNDINEDGGHSISQKRKKRRKSRVYKSVRKSKSLLNRAKYFNATQRRQRGDGFMMNVDDSAAAVNGDVNGQQRMMNGGVMTPKRLGMEPELMGPHFCQLFMMVGDVDHFDRFLRLMQQHTISVNSRFGISSKKHSNNENRDCGFGHADGCEDMMKFRKHIFSKQALKDVPNALLLYPRMPLFDKNRFDSLINHLSKKHDKVKVMNKLIEDMAHLIGHNYSLRQWMLEELLSVAHVSTMPTSKGREQITFTHELACVQRLYMKPVLKLMLDSDSNTFDPHGRGGDTPETLWKESRRHHHHHSGVNNNNNISSRMMKRNNHNSKTKMDYYDSSNSNKKTSSSLDGMMRNEEEELRRKSWSSGMLEDAMAGQCGFHWLLIEKGVKEQLIQFEFDLKISLVNWKDVWNDQFIKQCLKANPSAMITRNQEYRAQIGSLPAHLFGLPGLIIRPSNIILDKSRLTIFDHSSPELQEWLDHAKYFDINNNNYNKNKTLMPLNDELKYYDNYEEYLMSDHLPMFGQRNIEAYFLQKLWPVYCGLYEGMEEEVVPSHSHSSHSSHSHSHSPDKLKLPVRDMNAIQRLRLKILYESIRQYLLPNAFERMRNILLLKAQEFVVRQCTDNFRYLCELTPFDILSHTRNQLQKYQINLWKRQLRRAKKDAIETRLMKQGIKKKKRSNYKNKRKKSKNRKQKQTQKQTQNGMNHEMDKDDPNNNEDDNDELEEYHKMKKEITESDFEDPDWFQMSRYLSSGDEMMNHSSKYNDNHSTSETAGMVSVNRTDSLSDYHFDHMNDDDHQMSVTPPSVFPGFLSNHHPNGYIDDEDDHDDDDHERRRRGGILSSFDDHFGMDGGRDLMDKNVRVRIPKHCRNSVLSVIVGDERTPTFLVLLDEFGEVSDKLILRNLTSIRVNPHTQFGKGLFGGFGNGGSMGVSGGIAGNLAFGATSGDRERLELKSKDMRELTNFLLSRRPTFIIIDASSLKARSFREDLDKVLMSAASQDDHNNRHNSNKERPLVTDDQIYFVNPVVAHTYKTSVTSSSTGTLSAEKMTTLESLGVSGALSGARIDAAQSTEVEQLMLELLEMQAICLGRFALNPLAELCNHFQINLNTGQNEILKLLRGWLFLQCPSILEWVPSQRIQESFERLLYECVSRRGIEINTLHCRPWLSGQLRFVPGFGPEKASEMLFHLSQSSAVHKLLNDRQKKASLNGWVQSRYELLDRGVLSENIWLNSIACLRVSDLDGLLYIQLGNQLGHNIDSIRRPQPFEKLVDHTASKLCQSGRFPFELIEGSTKSSELFNLLDDTRAHPMQYPRFRTMTVMVVNEGIKATLSSSSSASHSSDSYSISKQYCNHLLRKVRRCRHWMERVDHQWESDKEKEPGNSTEIELLRYEMIAGFGCGFLEGLMEMSERDLFYHLSNETPLSLRVGLELNVTVRRATIGGIKCRVDATSGLGGGMSSSGGVGGTGMGIGLDAFIPAEKFTEDVREQFRQLKYSRFDGNTAMPDREYYHSESGKEERRSILDKALLDLGTGLTESKTSDGTTVQRTRAGVTLGDGVSLTPRNLTARVIELIHKELSIKLSFLRTDTMDPMGVFQIPLYCDEYLITPATLNNRLSLMDTIYKIQLERYGLSFINNRGSSSSSISSYNNDQYFSSTERVFGYCDSTLFGPRYTTDDYKAYEQTGEVSSETRQRFSTMDGSMVPSDHTLLERSIHKRKIRELKDQPFIPRDVAHGSFYNIDLKAAQERIRDMPKGSVIFRPSSTSALRVTESAKVSAKFEGLNAKHVLRMLNTPQFSMDWKMHDEPCIIVHFHVIELDRMDPLGQGMSEEAILAGDRSLGKRLKIEGYACDDKEFEDLDQIEVEFVSQLNRFTEEMTQFDLFKIGNEEETAEVMITQYGSNHSAHRMTSRKLQSAICFSHSQPGYFTLVSIKPGKSKVEKELIKVDIKGFKFRGFHFDKPRTLINWYIKNYFEYHPARRLGRHGHHSRHPAGRLAASQPHHHQQHQHQHQQQQQYPVSQARYPQNNQPFIHPSRQRRY